MAAIPVPRDEAEFLCRLTKKGSPQSEWDYTLNSGMQMDFGVVCSPPQKGLIVSLRLNAGYKVRRRTINLGLWKVERGVWSRAYQLTVADKESPTHREAGELWYGSHEHIGPDAVRANHFDSAPFDTALEHFCRVTTLTLEDPIEDPLDFKLK